MKTQSLKTDSLPPCCALCLVSFTQPDSQGGAERERGEASDNPGLHVNLVIRGNSLSSMERKTFLFKIFSSDNNNSIVFLCGIFQMTAY